MLADRYMAAEGGVVDHDHMVAEDAVMGDMGADHQEASLADGGHSAPARRAPVYRHMLANDAVGADRHRCRLAPIAQILRRPADRGEGLDFRAGADPGPADDHRVRMDHDAVLEDGLGSDDRERSDADAFAETGAILDDRRGVNIGHRSGYSSAIRALMTASATLVPLTIASALNFQILPRLRTLRTWYSTVSPGITGLRNLALSIVMK